MRLLLILLLAFFPLHVSAAPQNIQVPNAVWEKIYFEEINLVTGKVKWESLRTESVTKGSQEIRVWIGFGRAPLYGLRLKYDGKKWSGDSASGLPKGGEFEARSLIFPDGWDKTWERIEALGIFSLPDSSTLQGEEMVLDGESYVVEFNNGELYRTYMYANPEYQKWPEAKKIIEIIKLLRSNLKNEKT